MGKRPTANSRSAGRSTGNRGSRRQSREGVPLFRIVVWVEAPEAERWRMAARVEGVALAAWVRGAGKRRLAEMAR